MFTTYILESEKLGKYYIGWTANIKSRIQKHNTGGSRWTRQGMPWKLVYTKQFPTKKEAIRFEKFLKQQKSKKIINNIIAG